MRVEAWELGASASPGRARPLRVVAAGGGTGLPNLLSGLGPGEGRPPVEVAALVTVADDGGSSGELRRRYRMPAMGDARNCLVALSAQDNPLALRFQHRLAQEGDVAGHTVGNLVLAALAHGTGDFGAAVDAAGRLLGARGRVLPAVRGEATLVAALADGRTVHGEASLRAAGGRIAAVRLEGRAAAPLEAREAVRQADLVVLGPGSLYTSVLASVLGEGMAEALRGSRATRVLVVNLFTEPGETDGLDAAAHLAAVQRHLGDVVDVVLLPRGPLPAELVGREARRGARPVAVDRAAVERLGAVPVLRDLVSPRADARHDPLKLARALHDIARARGG